MIFRTLVALNKPVRHRSISTVNLTFFGKSNCGLCDEAHSVLDRVLKSDKASDLSSKVKLEQIDITAKGNEEWFDCYRYDIPVLHIDREGYKTVKFMHRLDPQELLEELTEDL